MRSEYPETSKGRNKNEKQLNLRRTLALGVAGLVTAVAFAPKAESVVSEIGDYLDGPDLHGSQRVPIIPGDTLDRIIILNVENGGSNTGFIGSEVKNDPRNQSIFENGTMLGPEDIGKELVIPESVED